MKTYAAPEHIPFPQFSDFRKADGYSYDYAANFKAEEEYIVKVQDWAKEQEPHPLAGELIRRPQGDGYALYVVYKSGTVGLIHLEVGDAWRDEYFERTATVKELTRIVEGQRAFQKFWNATPTKA